MLNRRIGMFPRLEIETFSMCNRTCSGCLRNSIPDKDATASWFAPNALHIDAIQRVFDQSRALGCSEVCLSHYNEPLMDERIVDIARRARVAGFSRVFFCSNADFLTETLAAELDELINDIGFSFYMNEPIRSKRAQWTKSLFKKTKIITSLGSPEEKHMVTHFSPNHDVIALSSSFRNNPCSLPTKRMIVNHKGEMLLCCDDLTGHFGLGNVHESSVEELWYGEKHQSYVEELLKAGGRKVHPHCLSCPRR